MHRTQNIAARYPHLFRALTTPILTGVALLALMPLGARSDEPEPMNHQLDSFSFSARMGFNISARFKNPGQISFATNGRKTPDGANYNYEDGYVLPDSSGDAGGYTYNWGYDSTAKQYSGGNILLSKTTSASGLSSPWMDMDPGVGGELTYRHQFGEFPKLHDLRWGFEAAGSLVNASASDHRTYGGNVTRRTDAYPLPGTTPPDATPDSPFTGTFMGPNIVLGDTPISSTFSSGPAVVSGVRKIDTDIWGFRLGPYVEVPIAKKLNLSFSGGVAGAVLDIGTSWNETLSVGTSQYAFSGSGRDHAWRFGYYLGASADWEFKPQWSVIGGVQFQSLANYNQSISGRPIEIDLSNTIFVTLGLAYHF